MNRPRRPRCIARLRPREGDFSGNYFVAFVRRQNIYDSRGRPRVEDEDDFPISEFSLSEAVGYKNNQLFSTEKEWKQPDCMMLSSDIIARMQGWMIG